MTLGLVVVAAVATGVEDEVVAITTGEAEVAAVEVEEVTAVEGAVTVVADIVVGEGMDHLGVTEIVVAMTGTVIPEGQAPRW